MRFAQPNFALSILLVFVLIVFYVWAFKMRTRALKRFSHKDLLKELLSHVDPFRQKLKASLIISGVIFALCALMRPQWGFHWEEVKRKGIDILIAIDTSKSMLAQDVKPSRLERSKLAVRDFVRNLKGDRVGLIAFAGSAFLECPLTVDYGGFLLSLESISTDIIPKGGTSLSSAIREAIRSYEGGRKKYKVLILITDGEDHEGDPAALAAQAKKEGIIVFCIGIGTKEGELIPIEHEFLKDMQGNVVKSRLDEATLQKIAFTTEGSYLRATSTEFGLDLLYREKLSKMEKRELESRMAKHYEERFQIPLFIAVLFLLYEALVDERKKRRNPPFSYMKKYFCALLYMTFTGYSFIPCAFAGNSARTVTKAIELHKAGKYDEALKLYSDALTRNPDSAVIHFDRGASEFKKGEYEKAAGSFEKATITKDTLLEAKANYNLGNTQYALGKRKENTDPAYTARLLREALEYYKRAIELNSKDEDAKLNYELVEKELKVLIDRLKQTQNKKDTQGVQGENKEDKEKQEGGRSAENKQEEKQDPQAQKESPAQKKEEQGGKEASGENSQIKEGMRSEAEKNAQQKDGSKGEEVKKQGEEKTLESQESISHQPESKEMTQKEAAMLLEGYRQQEGMRGTLHDTRKGYSEEVAKDW